MTTGIGIVPVIFWPPGGMVPLLIFAIFAIPSEATSLRPLRGSSGYLKTREARHVLPIATFTTLAAQLRKKDKERQGRKKKGTQIERVWSIWPSSESLIAWSDRMLLEIEILVNRMLKHYKGLWSGVKVHDSSKKNFQNNNSTLNFLIHFLKQK